MDRSMEPVPYYQIIRVAGQKALLCLLLAPRISDLVCRAPLIQYLRCFGFSPSLRSKHNQDKLQAKTNPGKRIEVGLPALSNTAAVFPSISYVTQQKTMIPSPASAIMPIQMNSAFLPNNSGIAYMMTPVLIQGLSPATYGSVNQPSYVIKTLQTQLPQAVSCIQPIQEVPAVQPFQPVQSVQSPPQFFQFSSNGDAAASKQAAQPSQTKTAVVDGIPPFANATESTAKMDLAQLTVKILPKKTVFHDPLRKDHSAKRRFSSARVQGKPLQPESPTSAHSDEGSSAQEEDRSDDSLSASNEGDTTIHCSCQKAHCLKLYGCGGMCNG